MVHTNRDEIERTVPSFVEQLGDPLPGREHWQRCTTCLRPIDPDEEGPTRYRHSSCPPVPVPRVVTEAVERMRARDARREYVAGALQHSDEERRP